MKRLQLFLSSLVLISGTRSNNTTCHHTVEGHVCVTSYWDSVRCELNITHDGEKDFTLRFSEASWNKSCTLELMDQRFHSVCQLKFDPEQFMWEDVYDIDLCCKSTCTSLAKEYQPSQSIQPTPPYEVQVQNSPENLTVTWRSGYEDHMFLDDALSFEVQLEQRSSSRTKRHILPTTSDQSRRKTLTVELPRPQTDGECCVRVRSITSVDDYEATWSRWSPEACRKIEMREDKSAEKVNILLVKYLGPLSTLVAHVLILFFWLALKMKRFSVSTVPSPAPSFLPLYEQHRGNLQEWLSPHGKSAVADINQMKPTISLVIAEPKEKLRYPPVQQLSFSNGSDVDLQDVITQKFPMTRLLDTSCAQLPCEFFVGDDGSSALIQAGSCLSDGKPFLGHCSDYCSLNPTGDGIIPVMVPKKV